MTLCIINLQSCSKRKRSAGARQLTGPDDKVFSTSKMLHILPGANSATASLGTRVVLPFVGVHIYYHPCSCRKGSIYTPQNDKRTNAINYNIDAFCVERILKTNFTILLKFLAIFDALLPSEKANGNGRKCY